MKRWKRGRAIPKLRKRHTKDYTVVANEVIRDQRLSYKARGIFLYLWYLPDDWEISLADIVKHSREDGQVAVRTGVSELETYGYLSFERVRIQGKFVDTEWTITEKPSLENPTMVDATMENPITPKYYPDPSTKAPNTRKKGYSDSFLQFWSAYPVKKEKGAAWKSWSRQNLDAFLDRILASVKDHLSYDVTWQQGFIKNPATFLNKKCWEDELDMPGQRSKHVAI